MVTTAEGVRRILLERIRYVERIGRIMRYDCTDGAVDSLSIRSSFRDMVAPLLASGSSGLFTAAMFSIMITPILSSPLVFIVFRKRQQRTTVLLTGLVIGVANMLIAIAMGFVNNTDLNGIFINSLWSAGSGLLSAMFCIGIGPSERFSTTFR